MDPPEHHTQALSDIPLDEFIDFALGPLLVPLPTPRNAKKRDLKIVEVTQRGGFEVTIYKYKVTNYGYTVTKPGECQLSLKKPPSPSTKSTTETSECNGS